MLVGTVTDDAQVKVPDFMAPLPVIRTYAPLRNYYSRPLTGMVPKTPPDSIECSWDDHDPREWKRAECRGSTWTHLTPGQAKKRAPVGEEEKIPYIDAYSLAPEHGPETVPEEWCSCGWYGKFYPWPSRIPGGRDLGIWERHAALCFSNAASAYIMEVKGEVMVHDSGVRAEYARLTHRIMLPTDAGNRAEYWEDVVGDKVILPREVDVPKITLAQAVEMLVVWPTVLTARD